ncbi:MAG TPA: L,D-transpeptidase family protein [Steroidobacteraceae bacterium]|nr:L,D-transpeptidase family protein [Steroidobacteraceae bacterium]
MLNWNPSRCGEHLARVFARLDSAARVFLAVAATAGALIAAAGVAAAADLDQPRAVATHAVSKLPEPTEGVPLSPADLVPLADRVVVHKAERRLYLMRGVEVLRSYRVALGLNPTGQKERSGDFRTPEGRYYLARRNPRSDYFLSILVSYPNELDMQRARRHRWDAGGSIMIHGLPNQLKRSPGYYEKTDWTDGCIAVSNSEMLEIWLMTQDGTPIDILP